MADLIGTWDPTNCIFGALPENLKLARDNTDQEHVDLSNFNTQNMPCFQGESAPSFVSLVPSGTATNYWYNDGKLVLDGVDDNGSLSHIINFTDLSTQTFEINISNRTLGVAGMLICSYVDSGNYWYTYINTDNTVWFTIRNSGVTSEVKTSTTIGTSSKITCRKNAGVLDIWLDGIEASYSTQDTYNIGTTVFTRTDVCEWVGSGSPLNFSGNIEKLVYYDDAISDARIITNAGLDSALGLTVTDRQLNELLTVQESSRSIGSRTIQTALSGTIDATGWEITMSADTAWGVGDEISIDTGGTPESGFVYSRSGNVFRLQSKTTKIGTLTCSIERSCDTPVNWEINACCDLPTLGIIAKGVCYADNDFIFTATLTVGGATTDITHYRWITAAADGGVRFTGNGGSVSVSNAHVRLRDNYTVFENIIMTDLINVENPILIYSGITNCTVRNNILHKYTHTGNIFGIYCSNAGENIIYNNQLFNIWSTGLANVARGIRGDGTTSNVVYNNTLYKIFNALNTSGDGAYGISSCFGKNNIVTNVTSNFGTPVCYSSSVVGSDYNIATDTTTIGANSINNAVVVDLFKDLTVSAEDLGLKEGSAAIGTGDDLSSLFTVDAVNLTRTVPWDIGALKYIVVVPSGGGNNTTGRMDIGIGINI